MQPFQPLGPRQPLWLMDSSSLLKRNQLGTEDDGVVSTSGDQVSLSHRDKHKEEEEREEKTYRRPVLPRPPMPVPKLPAAGGFILKPGPQPKATEKSMREKDLPGYGRWSKLGSEPEPWLELEVSRDWSLPDWLEPLLADPAEKPGRTRLAWLLARFGRGIIKRCIDFGLRVHLGAEFSCKDLKLTVLSGAAPLLVYQAFAGAYDLVLGDGHPASLSSLAVISNFHQCRGAGTAWTGPEHYFAQQMAVFLDGQPTASIAMGGYLDYLLKQSHG